MKSWPSDFQLAMQHMLGRETVDFFRALESTPPVSLRWNLAKSERKSPFQSVPWCAAGEYIAERPIFTLDPRFHAGAYYVQDASCMLLEAVLKQLPVSQSPVLALDLCAAPGGKSTHLMTLLHPESLLIANEIMPARVQILTENMIKWGADRVMITQNRASDFQRLPFAFDLILVDAPCSGEGLFRKQESAQAEWSLGQVERCARRQHEILTEIWSRLKPGGYLIYSTCTWNRHENEDLIQSLCQQLAFEQIDLAFPEHWQVHVSDQMPLYRCFPHRIQGEGLSLTVLRKTDEEPSQARLRGRARGERSVRSHPVQPPLAVLEWLTHTSAADLYLLGSDIWRWPARQAALLKTVQAELNLRYAGVRLANIKGRDLCPDSALALYPGLNRHSVSVQPLTLTEALKYLNREVLAGQGQNWVLASYEGLALGWFKATATHLNNYWPKAWKIRQSFQQVDLQANLKRLP
jgi:16S rRNA C967 or C1407 C5-methylase (RsmB/RsmF family)